MTPRSARSASGASSTSPQCLAHFRIPPAALAAAYGFGIAENHPFIDGNKRAALMAIYTFAAINDFELEAPEPEAVSIILAVAEGSATEDELATWIRSHLIPWTD